MSSQCWAASMLAIVLAIALVLTTSCQSPPPMFATSSPPPVAYLGEWHNNTAAAIIFGTLLLMSPLEKFSPVEVITSLSKSGDHSNVQTQIRTSRDHDLLLASRIAIMFCLQVLPEDCSSAHLS